MKVVVVIADEVWSMERPDDSEVCEEEEAVVVEKEDAAASAVGAMVMEVWVSAEVVEVYACSSSSAKMSLLLTVACVREERRGGRERVLRAMVGVPRTECGEGRRSILSTTVKPMWKTIASRDAIWCAMAARGHVNGYCGDESDEQEVEETDEDEKEEGEDEEEEAADDDGDDE